MPIVIGRGPAIVGAGLAESFERPGGVTTGIDEPHPGETDKSLRILKDAAPTIRRVAVLSLEPTLSAHEAQYSEARHRPSGPA